MQQHWLTRQPDNRRLLIVALGWAASPAAAPQPPPGYDMLCLCDYRTIEELEPTELEAYERIDLAAWSFGVMAAEKAARRLTLHGSLAFNGSPLPVHDRYGIPVRSFLVTLKGLRRAGTDLFFQRVYGGADHIPPSHLPKSPLGELIEELEALYAAAQQPREQNFRWSAAFIGSRDAIFPPRNLIAFWENLGNIFDAPHYPFSDPSVLIDALDHE